MTEATSRELETLFQLACFHYLTSLQVEALLFAGSGLRPDSRTVATKRVLRGLLDRGLVGTTPRLIGGPGGGAARRAYAITPRGQACLAAHDRRAGPPPARRGTLFVEHALTTADVAIAFRRAARAKPGPELISWESDSDLAPAISGSPVLPDARVVLATEAYTLEVLLEVDRGTERPAAFAKKIAAYLSWHMSGAWRAYLPMWPLILVIVPTAVRAASLRRTTERVLTAWGTDGVEVRFAALAHVQDVGPFAEIWQVTGAVGLHPLLEVPAPAAVPA
jgi:hypothetical protein